MANPQSQILRPVPPVGRFITWSLPADADVAQALAGLGAMNVDRRVVVGLGAPLAVRAGAALAGLRGFPTDLGMFPAAQHDLWAFVAGNDPSALFDVARAFTAQVPAAFVREDEIDAFTYKKGRDLSGFEDGTENPKGKAATLAAFVRGRGAGLDGGSFVAVQKFVHDLRALESMPAEARDHVIGRRLKSNKELPDAPASAHVKRTAQESFMPPAFILRRSMPWGSGSANGLVFVAYGESLDRFESILRRMAGRQDGIVDAITSYTRALSGGYYFCPPVLGGKLDLRAFKPAAPVVVAPAAPTAAPAAARPAPAKKPAAAAKAAGRSRAS